MTRKLNFTFLLPYSLVFLFFANPKGYLGRFGGVKGGYNDIARQNALVFIPAVRAIWNFVEKHRNFRISRQSRSTRRDTARAIKPATVSSGIFAKAVEAV